MKHLLASVAVQVQPKTVKGKDLAHRKLTKAGRALLAADIVSGNVKLDELSIKQISHLLNVSVAYITAARSLDCWQRSLVEDSVHKLSEFLPARALPSPQQQITQLVQQIGVDQTLELLAAAE